MLHRVDFYCRFLPAKLTSRFLLPISSPAKLTSRFLLPIASRQIDVTISIAESESAIFIIDHHSSWGPVLARRRCPTAVGKERGRQRDELTNARVLCNHSKRLMCEIITYSFIITILHRPRHRRATYHSNRGSKQ